MSDTTGQSAPNLDRARHTLSLDEVMAQLVAAGVPRSRRHVQRLCESGALDAQKFPGASGDEWFVAPDSVPRTIGDLRAMQDRRSRLRHAGSQLESDHAPINSNSDTAGYTAVEPAASDPHGSQEGRAPAYAISRYVQLLEQDNEFLREQVKKKDEQIGDLSERFSETQTLLGAMQRMFAPLLGQTDPFGARGKTDLRDSPN